MRRIACATLLIFCVACLPNGVAWGAMVIAPPNAPDWWNSEAANYWGYAYSPDGQPPNQSDPTQFDSNFIEFGVTVTESEATKPSEPNEGFLGEYIQIKLDNGFQPTLVKRFFFYASGTGASLAPETSADPVSVLPSPPCSDYLVRFDSGVDASGNWHIYYEGIAIPQPDTVYFSFNVWGESMGMQTVDLTRYAVGEVCIPEPATIVVWSVLGVLGLTFGWRRRRSSPV